MKTLLRFMAVSTGTLASVSVITNCQSTCEERGDCNTFTGKGGASGTGGSGTGGDKGGSSTGGTAGTAGTAGLGGDGGAGGEGGGGGAGGAGPDPCDPLAPEEGCAITDPDGIYVAPSGSDTEIGSRTAPFQTITKAISVAAGDNKTIYVCNGTFDEHLVVNDANIVIRGGYTCPSTGITGWIYTAAARARVRPDDTGYALLADGADNLTFSDVDFTSQDAAELGESSVAVFVTTSTGVSFARTRITAGDGADGEGGVLAGSNHTTVDLSGTAGVGATGGAAKECACQDNSKSTGASGGLGGVTPTPGGVGLPDYGNGGGARGEASTLTKSCTNGGLGSPGPDRADAPGAPNIGSIDAADGWVPRGGGKGLNGQPGQGGGGGGGDGALGGKGGAGGGACGGCGGLGAPGGQGGGASIGLLALNSIVSLDPSSRIQTGNAGSGGAGDAGETGQSGGTRGIQDGNGCLGGIGGKGATGGASGGGAGGISVGILSKGSTINATSVTIDPGNPGMAGQGGGADNDGAPGRSESTLVL